MEDEILDDKDSQKDVHTYTSRNFARSRIPGIFHTGNVCSRVLKAAVELVCLLLLTVVIVLSVERSHLNSTFKNLTAERDLLHSSFTALEVETIGVKTRLSYLEKHLNEGWMFFQSSLYYISHEKRSWKTARDDCMRRQADLVIIDNRDEQEFLTDIKKEFWIGLTDQNGPWEWVNGTLLSPTTRFWDSGQPNSYEGKEDCAEIRVRNYLTNWNDDLCNRPQLWACEKRLL